MFRTELFPTGKLSESISNMKHFWFSIEINVRIKHVISNSQMTS